MFVFPVVSSLSSDEAILRIIILRTGRVEEFAELFSTLDQLYKHMLVLDIISREAEQKARSKKNDKPTSIAVVKNPDDQIQASERLRLYRININSPGILEVIGKLNILENIRGLINDYYERKKDKEYRNDAERERLTQENESRKLKNDSQKIENSLKKTELIKQQSQLLSSVGVPESKIRDAIMQHLERPIDAINHQSEIGLIGESELINPIETDEKP